VKVIYCLFRMFLSDIKSTLGLSQPLRVQVLFGMGFWIFIKRLGPKTVGVEIGDSTGAEHL